ncbi:c-type cytochrome [Hymenobacter endophyticus]|uniref:Cytochrome c n=1 Tax=Hymenobacter endophyticus TaxID=3076335 RepID=A0ABU3TKR5_9BACT|nr:cytochrome c [Hymenobacter endophyticus]MDU0371965.1 cytochrome c [Hymenobacter endophyticus]
MPKTSIGSIYESEAYKQALQAADSVQDKPLPAASAGLLSGRDVRLSPVLDEAMVAKGQRLYASNCQACHSLGTDKTVGPGWQGITVRRQPEWILNMILHTDAMLTHDATARKLLAEYQVRMPTQTISQDEARQVLEFMRTLK